MQSIEENFFFITVIESLRKRKSLMNQQFNRSIKNNQYQVIIHQFLQRYLERQEKIKKEIKQINSITHN